MRIYDETKTLPMPRPKTVIVPARRPPVSDNLAEATARPRAAAAEGLEANWPGAGSQLRKHASASAATALAATPAGNAIAGKLDVSAFIATTISIKAALDPARFFKLSGDISGSGQFPIVTADKASLRATLDSEKVQKVRDRIEQHGGPGRVALILHGRLGPNNTVLSPGLAVNPKPQKS